MLCSKMYASMPFWIYFRVCWSLLLLWGGKRVNKETDWCSDVEEREIEERWWKGWFLSEPEGAGSDSAGIGRASCSFSLTELDHLSLLLTESIKIQLPITDCGLWDHAAWLRYIFENQKQAERRREAVIVKENSLRKKVARERER